MGKRSNMAKILKVSKKKILSEHKNLLNVLTNPTKQRLKQEAKKQGRELEDLLQH